VKTRTYQIALASLLTVCAALAAALGYVLFVRGHAGIKDTEEDPVIARGPAVTQTPQSQQAPMKQIGAMPADEPPLTPVQLSPQRLQQIGVTMATVAMKNVTQDLTVPGNVDMDEERLAYVQTRFAGWIQTVWANANYQYVRKGQRLFTVYSPDLVSSEQELLLARQNEQAFAHDAHGMAAQEGGWLLKSAEERLRQFGVSQEQIAALEASGKAERDMVVSSPVSGYIVERNALPNAYVQPETKLYTVADLSTVWVYANVFQTDVGRLKPGDAARVTVDAYPGRTFHGRIDQILPQVDSTTRTVRVRLVFANPGVVLKPGMYVNAAIAVPLGRQLVIPASAVLQAGSRAIAFVDHGGGNLEPRTIETGPQLDDTVVVLKGLKEGERVVSSANFLVDSEAQLQSAFAGAPAPAQPATTTAQPAEAIQGALTTDPSPARKGVNTLRVALTGSDGKPVTGAQVSVVFLMPAMPAMGMAATRVPAALHEKGNGQYEGSLQLDTGGTWEVSVTVQRAGQNVATRQLSVSAEGGM
jgi:Cu(I)/Ag(I) efflux system membrane fusion protein/cobalt-zinc-cadmium efflux system membrane fusion protein